VLSGSPTRAILSVPTPRPAPLPRLRSAPVQPPPPQITGGARAEQPGGQAAKQQRAVGLMDNYDIYDNSRADFDSWLYEWGNELESGVRGPGSHAC
jgi:hypothetical protein